jgi:hypothetical protein
VIASDLFTYAEALALRDAGLAQAASHSHRFADLAYAAIERVARRQVHVHVDDILAENVPQPNHYNAWGQVWMRAIRDGLLQRSNQTRPCKTDAGKHAHRYPIYFSLIYDPRIAP